MVLRYQSQQAALLNGNIGVESDAGCGKQFFMKAVYNRMRISANESSLQRGFAVSISASSVIEQEIGVESDAGCGEQVFMKAVYNRMRVSANESSLQRGFAVSILASSAV